MPPEIQRAPANNTKPLIQDRSNSMRAILCKEYGPAEKLVIEDIDCPEPTGGQVPREPPHSSQAG